RQRPQTLPGRPSAPPPTVCCCCTSTESKPCIRRLPRSPRSHHETHRSTYPPPAGTAADSRSPPRFPSPCSSTQRCPPSPPPPRLFRQTPRTSAGCNRHPRTPGTPCTHHV